MKFALRSFIIKVFVRLKRFHHFSLLYIFPVLCKKLLPENAKVKILKQMVDLFKVSDGYKDFFYRGFLLQTLTIYRTAGKGRRSCEMTTTYS